MTTVPKCCVSYVRAAPPRVRCPNLNHHHHHHHHQATVEMADRCACSLCLWEWFLFLSLFFSLVCLISLFSLAFCTEFGYISFVFALETIHIQRQTPLNYSAICVYFCVCASRTRLREWFM